jgi:chondroitin-sulfate-ABC endolyase/exolyase
LIFIGTDISSKDPKNPVQTSLFQSYLTDKNLPLATSVSGKVHEFPYQATLPLKTTLLSNKEHNKNHLSNWIIDPYGNGYHLLSDNEVTINRSHQHSLHNKFSLHSGKMNSKGKGVTRTSGDFASAWIDHGVAPKKGGYQYVVYPFISKVMNQKHINNFAKITNTQSTYNVLQANSHAHIVTDNITNTTGYAIFSSAEPIKHGLLSSTSAPALVMIQKLDKQTATLSVVQPDLNFAQLKPIKGYSQPVPLTIILKGKWQVPEHTQITSVAYSQGNTEINLVCQHGLPVAFEVQKRASVTIR